VATTPPASGSFLYILRQHVPGLSFDLPTEAQWEYACRAGTDTSLNAGTGTRNVAITDAGADAATDQVGRYYGNRSDGRGGTGYVSTDLARPGCYLPNAAGLYDMHGNVYEWCLDTWSTPINPAHSQEDPVDAVVGGTRRVLRGGGWGFNAQDCRSAHRGSNVPSFSYIVFGFRLAAVAD
jgi:formylglycine-generating enzyme required for sulfatase activity